MKPSYPLLLIMLIILITCSSNAIAAPLRSAIASMETVSKERLFDGTVEAVRKATISAQVSGRISVLNFDVDDVVKKGEVILRIRNTEYKARLLNTKATLKEAKANLTDAQLELARVSGLYVDKIVSASIFDKTKAQFKASEARVAASKAKVSEAQEQLNNTIIRAPYSGVVVERHVELGETTQPGQPLMTGLSLDKLRVAVDVPQNIVNAIRQQNSARIVPLTLMYPKQLTNSQSINSQSIVKWQQEPLSIEDIIIFPFAQPKSHTFHIRANLKKGVKTLLPGMLVKIAFKVDNSKRLLIPTSAVVRRSELVATYIIGKNAQIKLRQIRLGHSFNKKIEVLAGLDPGEKVAIDPIQAGIKLKQQQGAKQ